MAESNILSSSGPATATQPRPRWWKEGKQTLHTALLGTATFLRDKDTERRQRFLRLAGLYANRAITDLMHDAYDLTPAKDKDVGIRMNVIRNMVDSVTAKIAKNKPKPTVVTDGGDFTLRQQAKRLDTYIWGQFCKNDVYPLVQGMFRDGAVFGSGVLKVVEVAVDDELGRINVERTFPWELFVDPLEAMYGAPRSLFQTKLVDRHVLLDAYGEGDDAGSKARREAIEKAPVVKGSAAGRDAYAEQILVVEAWHLPSGEGAKDGRHAIVIETGCLFEEKWTDLTFPFVILHWSRPLMGFWGDALTEEVEDLQNELHELMTKVQAAFYHHSTPKLITWDGSTVTAKYDNDLRGQHIEVAGGANAPVWVAPSVVAPEVFQHIDRISTRIYEVGGVSQLSAQSKKPAGIDSAVAMQEYNDIESERFVIRGQDLEGAVVRLGEEIVRASRRLDARELDVEVRAESRKRRKTYLEKIRWSQIKLPDDAFRLKTFPTSSLPQSPPGRIAAVESMAKAGILPPEDLKQLIDFPDTESVMSRELAPYELVLDQMERMVDEQEPVMPSPYQNVELAHRLVQLTICQFELDSVPEDRLELLREYVSACEDLLDVAKKGAAMAAAPPIAPPMPGADPMAPPMPMPAPVPPPMPMPEAA